jgi:endonuclease/exonuclease/phosphatase family metal-dependent hydrolase
MAKLAVYKYFSFMFLVITLLMAIFTFFGLFGGSSNPANETAIPMIVYVLPLLIIGNAVMLLFWLLRRRWHWAAIPAVTLLCCIPYIGTVYQTGLFSSGSDKAGIKIATYNVALFGREISGFKAEDILSEMKRQQVDILCMQEYAGRSGDKDNTASYLSFFGSMAKGHEDMVIFSRFPIKASGTIDFGPTNNSAMWADINVNGRIIRVFNTHLETTGFNRTLHQAAKIEIQGGHVKENALIRAIYGNYTRGMIQRAIQADIVAHKVKESKYPVIVCGDFNDVPYSYTYNMMKGDLVDGFKECGKGFMYTFRGKKKVRIDYIFHDEVLVGETYFKTDISYSDHFPVFMKVAL